MYKSPSRLAGIAALAGFLLVFPQICLAGLGAAMLVGFIQAHIINQALMAFFGIAAAAAFYYAVRMIVTAPAEGAYTEISNSFIHMFSGFAVIACGSAIVSIFATPAGPLPGAINTSFLGTAINSVTDFIYTGCQGIFALMGVIAGIGMVTSQGDEAAFGKWRKVLIGNIIGIVIMVIAQLSTVIWDAIFNNNPMAVVLELKGIAIFLLQVIGFVSVLALIVAGIMMIISIDESLRDRSKKIVIGTLIAIALVISCYTLIVTFV